MQRKLEDRTLLFSPEIGISSLGKPMFPKGMVSGVQLETVLREIATPGYIDFDTLPIPFRAVATDLETGKAVIFDQGELTNVMRASMSVPVAIAPVEINGKILVDGMLVNNLPVDVARSMGADIIIAVNVGTPLMKREELGSILGIAGQMISILTEQNVQAALASLKPTDILISPELGDFTTSDFDNLPITLPIGEAAARKVSDKLSRLSLPPEQYASYQQRIRPLIVKSFPPVDKIRFKDLKRVNPEYVESLMDTKTGKSVDLAVLNRDMRKIYGTRYFEHVNYRIIEEKGERILEVAAVEKSWGPDYYRFGLGLDTDFQGNALFTVQNRFRKTWLNSMGTEWITDLKIGSTNSLTTGLYIPLDYRHQYFAAPTIEFKQSPTYLYSGSDLIARFNGKRYRAGLDFGREFDQYGMMRVGVKGGFIDPSIDIGPPSLSPPPGSIQEGAFTADLLLDKLNSVTFPTAGWVASANLFNSNKNLGADFAYTKYDVRGSYVQSFGNNTFSVSGIANGKLDGTIPFYDLNQFGGLLRQSGYRVGQMYGESLNFGRLMYYKKLLDYQMFDGLYTGFSLEMGRMRNPLIAGNSEDWVRSASAFLATDSPVGPVYFGYGHADDGNHSLYLYLGLPIGTSY